MTAEPPFVSLQGSLGPKQIEQFFDLLPVAAFCTSPEGKFLCVNESFARLLGYSVKELKSKLAPDLYQNKADREVWKEILERQLRHTTWLSWKKRSGEVIWVTNHAQFITLETGGNAYIGIAEPSTGWNNSSLLRKKWFEDDLRSSQTNKLFNSMPICVSYKSKDGIVRYANEIFCRREAECTPDELANLNLSDNIYPQHLAARYQLDDQLVMSRQVILDQIEPHIQGSRSGDQTTREGFPVRVIKAPVWKSETEVSGVLCIFWDASEQGDLAGPGNRPQQPITESDAPYNIHFEHDQHGKFTKLNERGQQVTGYTEEEFKQESITSIVTRDFKAVAERLLKGSTPHCRFEILHRHTKAPLLLEVISQLVSEPGGIPYFRGIARYLQSEQLFEKDIKHSIRNQLEALSDTIRRELSACPDCKSERTDYLQKRLAASAWLINHASRWKLATIHAQPLLIEFVDKLKEVFCFTKERISITVECPSDLVVRGNVMETCLRTVVEGVTNCFKHAFPKEGEVSVEKKIEVHLQTENEVLVLRIMDNGDGLSVPSNSGQGISLANDYARQHGGFAKIEERKDQDGVCHVSFFTDWKPTGSGIP